MTHQLPTTLHNVNNGGVAVIAVAVVIGIFSLGDCQVPFCLGVENSLEFVRWLII